MRGFKIKKPVIYETLTYQEHGYNMFNYEKRLIFKFMYSIITLNNTQTEKN